MKYNKKREALINEKHTKCLRYGYSVWPTLEFGKMPAMGDARWTADLIYSIWEQAKTGKPPHNELEYRVGQSGGGFDLLDFKFLPENEWLPSEIYPDLSLSLNRRSDENRR